MLKEEIDALIKFNHYLIKNYIKENKDKNMNIIDYLKNNDENNIYNRNKWTEPINLFYTNYVLQTVRNSLLVFYDIIIDLYDINNKSFNKNKNNLEIPPIKKKCNNFRKDNNTNTNSNIKILIQTFFLYLKH